jgi:transglutaminase-like putative cysteine protease
MVTTFHNWADVGSWYRALSADRVVVTPAVKAKADELVRGKQTDEEKISAIYSYVSTQIRYISVSFGIGRYQPHNADRVLENQYGDCKDKHTLLATMLKAEGIEGVPCADRVGIEAGSGGAKSGAVRSCDHCGSGRPARE